MKRLLLALPCTLLLTSAPTSAQSPEDSVVSVITGFFDAMRENDSSAARTAFTPDAHLFRATPNGLQRNDIDGIITAIGNPKESVWDEVIWDTEVHIDGNLASVWTKYAFYRGTSFSHCGVDSFQLYRQPDGWKIYLITDTMRQQGCETPPNR
jgi:ketosteroid isomerase-like protein